MRLLHSDCDNHVTGHIGVSDSQRESESESKSNRDVVYFGLAVACNN